MNVRPSQVWTPTHSPVPNSVVLASQYTLNELMCESVTLGDVQVVFTSSSNTLNVKLVMFVPLMLRELHFRTEKAINTNKSHDNMIQTTRKNKLDIYIYIYIYREREKETEII